MASKGLHQLDNWKTSSAVERKCQDGPICSEGVIIVIRLKLQDCL